MLPLSLVHSALDTDITSPPPSLSWEQTNSKEKEDLGQNLIKNLLRKKEKLSFLSSAAAAPKPTTSFSNSLSCLEAISSLNHFSPSSSSSFSRRAKVYCQVSRFRWNFGSVRPKNESRTAFETGCALISITNLLEGGENLSSRAKGLPPPPKKKFDREAIRKLETVFRMELWSNIC